MAFPELHILDVGHGNCGEDSMIFTDEDLMLKKNQHYHCDKTKCKTWGLIARLEASENITEYVDHNYSDKFIPYVQKILKEWKTICGKSGGY